MTKKLNLLKMELDDLLVEVAAKRKEIEDQELARCIHVNLLVTHYIAAYVAEKTLPLPTRRACSSHWDG